MATTKLTGTLIRSGSIPTTALGGGVVSSSIQISSALPGGTVSSSAQVQPLLPNGTVSSSNQVQLNGITGTTFSNNDFTFPQALTVGGTLTAERIHTEYVTSSIIYESGSTKFGDTADDTHQFTGSLSVLGTISGTLILPTDTVSSSAQVVGPGESGRLAVFNSTSTISSSRIVELANGHVGIGEFNPSTRLHVLGTISASAINLSVLESGSIVSVNENKQLTSKDTTGTGDVVLKNSPTLTGTLTAANITATGSLNVVGTISGSLILPDGVVSSSTQVQTLLPAGTISSSTQIDVILDLDQVVSSSGQVKDLLPVGTVSSSAQYSGWVTSSTQIDYNNITNKLSGVISSSTQFNELTNTSASFATTASFALATSGVVQNANTASYVAYANIDGTPTLVSASSQIDITATTNYSTFSSSIATKNDLQDVSINALNAATSSYAVNTTIQGQLAGVVSSSGQVKNLLPDGTVSSSVQYPGWVTSSTQVLLSGISGTTFSTGDFTFPSSNLKVTGSLTVLGDISGTLLLPAGIVTASSQIVWSSVNYNTDIVSSSTQIKSLLPDGTVSSSTQYPGWVTASSQVDVRNTTGIATIATTGSNTFTATQTVIGNVFLSSSFPLVYNNSATNNMLFGLFDGSNIYGAYYQTFGNNYSELNQRGGAEFVYDTRNNSGANFHIASFNGATWTEKFRVDDNGAHVTGSLKSSGGITGSLLGTASFATTASFALATAGTVENANTASYVAYANIDGKPALVSASGQINHNSTNNYVADEHVNHMSVFINPGNGLSGGGNIAANVAFELDTGSVHFTDGIKKKLNLDAIVSSSGQIQSLLPGGTVSSSAQYPGWVTASGQIQLNAITGTTFSNAAFLFPQDLTLGGDLIVSGNDIRNNLGDDVITFRGTNNLDVRITSGSLDVWNGEIRNSGTTAIQMNGQNVVISGRVNINGDEIRSSLNQIALTLSNNNISTPGSASATGGFVGSLTGSILSPGVVSSSAQYPGWVTSSAQVSYTQLQNIPFNILSSSTFEAPTQGTARLTFNGNTPVDIDLGVQTTDTPTFAGVSSSNHITPTVDNTYNLGSPAKRWANIYTGDLVLSNEGSSGNTVDGTTGNWTIQEGEEHLYIINNKSGKKFRFMLSEIN